jgi:uncharacterized protein
MLAPNRQRIESLDVARGLALLGIFLVNVEFFARPLGAAIAIGVPDESGVSLALWWTVDVLCVGKLYPLFSLLFGMGLMLQRSNASSSGQDFAPLALRRLGFLATLGLIHGLLLWYGDILFVYAITGLLLCVVLGASGRVLLVAGALALALGVLAAAFVGALAGASPPPQPIHAAPSPPVERHEGHGPDTPGGHWADGAVPEVEADPLEVVWQQLRSSDPAGPEGPDWQAAETVAYARGPWIQAQGFRALSFLLALGSMAAGGGLPILAMFLFGAGAVRLDLLGARRDWLRRIGAIGCATGLPLAVIATWLEGLSGSAGPQAAAAACLTVAGALLAFGYLGLCDFVASSSHRFSPARLVTGMLAAAGRMALTNYLLQTIVATFVTYHWGLGRFGALERPERVALVLGVFAAQVVGSRLWLARFRFGPMEWLWRSFTYGAWQPMSRTGLPRSGG